MTWDIGAFEFHGTIEPPPPNPNLVIIKVPQGRSVKIVKNRKASNVIEIHVNKTDTVITQ